MPSRFGEYHTLHLDAQVIQPGRSYRQCSEVCREARIEASIAGNQEEAARLVDKKSILLLESETNRSSAIISWIQRYPSQCQVFLKSATLYGRSGVLQKNLFFFF